MSGMPVPVFVAKCAAKGITLSLDAAGRVRVLPPTAATDRLMRYIRANDTAVRAILSPRRVGPPRRKDLTQNDANLTPFVGSLTPNVGSSLSKPVPIARPQLRKDPAPKFEPVTGQNTARIAPAPVAETVSPFNFSPARQPLPDRELPPVVIETVPLFSDEEIADLNSYLDNDCEAIVVDAVQCAWLAAQHDLMPRERIALGPGTYIDDPNFWLRAVVRRSAEGRARFAERPDRYYTHPYSSHDADNHALEVVALWYRSRYRDERGFYPTLAHLKSQIAVAASATQTGIHHYGIHARISRPVRGTRQRIRIRHLARRRSLLPPTPVRCHARRAKPV